MSSGWIKLYRQITDCELWDNDEPFDRRSAWIDLLLMANHRDKQTIFDGKPITVKKGQRITSIRKLSSRWNWSVKKTMNYLELLESLQMITRVSDKRKTLLTVINYGIYQGDGNSNDNTDCNSSDNSHGNTDCTQTRNKELKNDKKNIYGEYKHVRLTEAEHERLVKDYGENQATSAIKYLDEYIEMKGAKYKSHNLALRKWVFDAVKQKKTTASNKFVIQESEQRQREIEDDLAFIEQAYLRKAVE